MPTDHWKITWKNSLFQTSLTSTVTVVFSSLKKKKSTQTHTHTDIKPACSATKQKQADILFVKPDLPYWLSDTGQGLSVACKPRKRKKKACE